jgi:hypothetical protein
MTNINTFQGNVGIGSTTPGYALTVRKNTNTLLLESENGGTNADVNIDFKSYDSQDPVGARISAKDDSAFGSDILFSTRTGENGALTERMRIQGGGSIDINGYIRHIGDENNLFGFSGTDTFKIATAGADRLTVAANGTVTLGVNMAIPDYIYHVGESDTYFGFSAADTIVMRTAGTNRLTVSSAGNVTLSNSLYVPGYIYHAGGDNNTYFGFSGNDTIVMRTSGTDRLTISSGGNVTLSNALYVPQYIYHSGDNDTYFGFSAANTIVMRTGGTDRLTVSSNGSVTLGVNLVIPDYIVHSGDENTKFGFSAADTFIIDTAGTNRLTVAANGTVTVAGTLTAGGFSGSDISTGTVAAARVATLNQNTSGLAATATKVQVSRDDTGDLANYLVFAPTSTAGQHNLQMDSGLIYDNTNNRLRLAQVMFGDQNVYGLGAVAGNYGSVGTVGTGKGSYEGYSINGNWVFMSNGAGSSGIYNDTNNEWATTWIQNGATNLYYNNSNRFQTTNDGAHCSGGLYADHMYIDDYLYHNGDTDTRIGFGTNTMYMRTGGADRLTIASSGIVTASHVIKQNGASWSMTNASASGVGTTAGSYAYYNRNLAAARNITITNVANTGGGLTRTRFTTTIAGRYAVAINGFKENTAQSSGTLEIGVHKNGSYASLRAYTTIASNYGGFATVGSAYGIIDMSANDFLEVAIGAGTYHGNDSLFFSGHLIA